MTLTTEIEGVTVDVDYTYTPPSRGLRDEYGSPLEPDWPADIEIDSVKTRYGEELIDLLRDSVINTLKNECEEDYAGRD